MWCLSILYGFQRARRRALAVSRPAFLGALGTCNLKQACSDFWILRDTNTISKEGQAFSNVAGLSGCAGSLCLLPASILDHCQGPRALCGPWESCSGKVEIWYSLVNMWLLFENSHGLQQMRFKVKDDYPNEHSPFRFHFGSQLVTAAGRENASPMRSRNWMVATYLRSNCWGNLPNRPHFTRPKCPQSGFPGFLLKWIKMIICLLEFQFWDIRARWCLSVSLYIHWGW